MKKPWYYYKGVRAYVFLYVGFLVLMEGLALVFPMLLKSVTELIKGDTTSGQIILSSAFVFAVVIIIFIVNISGELFGAVATAGFQRNLRVEMFERLQAAPAERINELGSGSILPIIMNDTSWIRNMQRNIMIFSVFFPIAIMGSIVMLLNLNLYYGLFALASLPFVDRDREIGPINYTVRESETISEIVTNVNNYWVECFTRFVLRDMSIENDWNRYLGELRAMGLDTYINTARTAYARMR